MFGLPLCTAIRRRIDAINREQGDVVASTGIVAGNHHDACDLKPPLLAAISRHETGREAARMFVLTSRLHHDYDAAFFAPRLDIAMRFRDLFQRIAAVDDGLELPRLDQLKEQGEIAVLFAGRA